MQIVDEFGMEIGGGLVVRTPSGFAPKYSPGCPLGFRAMVATANETQQPYSVNRNTSQRLPSQRKRNSSLVHLNRCCRSPGWVRGLQPGSSSGQTCRHREQNWPIGPPGLPSLRSGVSGTKAHPLQCQAPSLRCFWPLHNRRCCSVRPLACPGGWV